MPGGQTVTSADWKASALCVQCKWIVQASGCHVVLSFKDRSQSVQFGREQEWCRSAEWSWPAPMWTKYLPVSICSRHLYSSRLLNISLSHWWGRNQKNGVTLLLFNVSSWYSNSSCRLKISPLCFALKLKSKRVAGMTWISSEQNCSVLFFKVHLFVCC